MEDSSTLDGLDLKGDHFEIRTRLGNPVEEVPELLNFFAKEKSEALHWIKSKMSEMTHEKDASLKATLSLPDCLKNRRIPSAP